MNITKPGDAERALAASELRYRRLFETAQDGILILDEPTGQIVDVNPFLIDMLGYSREEYLGKKLWEIGFFKDVAKSQLGFEELRSKGYVRYEDLPLETKDGRKAEVEFVSNAYDAGGQKVIQCNIRDITARRAAEIALRESRRLTDGILNAIPVRVFWKDKNLVYLGCNAAFARDAGFTDPKDLVGKDDYQMVWRDQAELYRRDDQQVMESGRPKLLVEEPQTTPDGKTLTLLTSKIPLRSPSGEVEGILGTHLNITEHKRAEEARRASDEKYRRLFEVTRDATMIIEAPSWKFTSGNPAAFKMFGVSNEAEFASHGPWELSPERQPDGRASAEKAKAMVETALREGTNFFEWMHRRIDGAEFPADVLLTPLIQGKSLIIHCTVRDTTERKVAELSLQESEKRFRTVIEQAPEAVLIYDFDLSRFVLANKQAERLFALSRAELLKVGPTHFYSPSQPDARPSEETFVEHNRQVLAGEAVTFERRIRNAAGEERLCEVKLVPLPSLEGRLMRASYIDVTDRRLAEQVLAKTVRALKTLSHANGALVHATTEEGLFQEMCRIIVEVGGYRMAWIGLAEQDPAKTVRPVARAGHDAGYVDAASISWADNERGRSPTGTAARTGAVQVNQDFEHNPVMAPWRAEALKRGYASSIALPLRQSDGVFGVLTIDAAELDAFGPEEQSLLTELANDISFGLSSLRTRADRVEALHRLERAWEGTVAAVASTIEMRDAYTAGHQQRVTLISVAIAKELGLPADRIHGLRLAGTVHDLGKINIPADILSKPGKLTPIEYELVKTHSQSGYDILKPVEFPWPIADIVLQHHERLDGSGYPNGLKGDAILLEARILAVADVVESMMSHRPYRAALGIEAALAEIQQGRGKLYDPVAVDACVKLFRSGKIKFD